MGVLKTIKLSEHGLLYSRSYECHVTYCLNYKAFVQSIRLLPVLLVGMWALAGCGNGNHSGNGSHSKASAESGSQPVHKKRDIRTIKKSGVLRVVTRNAPTSYYIGKRQQAQGFEVGLVRAFAQSIGVKPKFIVENSIHDVLAALANGQGDLAAAGLTETQSRRLRFAFGASYQTIRQRVVCSREGQQPEDVKALNGVGLTVIGDSSYVEQLEKLKKNDPKLTWKTNDKVGTEALLRKVWKQKLDCTVADSNIVAVNQRYYPSLVPMFNLSPPEHLAWAMPHDALGLKSAIATWLQKFKGSGRLAALHKKYYAFFPKFNYLNTNALVQRINSRLPKYKQYFEKAAKQHDVPPLLLAAQGYQESQWNPNAKSPTGVRGIMMLTRSTAKSLGVHNRLNPWQSIQGGAKYLAKLEARFDSDIDASDRADLALAAYNLGYSHVRDAQRLAKRLGKNPHVWSNVQSVLPLLAQKRYYKKLKYGFAQGGSPVIYVRRIRNDADIIKAHQ